MMHSQSSVKEPESRFSGSFSLFTLPSTARETINSARKGRARIFLRGIHRLFQIHSRGFEPMRRFFQVVLIVATACGGGTAPAISGEAAAATDIRPAASDPIVAPVKRTAPQMPANLANQSATVAPAKKSDKASGKKAR